MKKKYEAPVLEQEFFELNANIAQNCDTTLSFGPRPTEDHPDICKEFDWGDYSSNYGLRALISDDCDCELSASNENTFSS